MLQIDLSDPSSIADKCLEAIALYGRIDIVVNNAGVSSRGSVLDSSIEVDRRVMEVNFFGTIALTKGKKDRLKPSTTMTGASIKTTKQIIFKQYLQNHSIVVMQVSLVTC